MTSLASPLPDTQAESRDFLPVKLALTLGLTALADWLFYDQRIGISMTLFAIALFAGCSLGNLVGLGWRRTAAAALVLFVGLVPAVEELNGLTFLIIVAALAYAISILTNPDLKPLFLGRLGAFRDLYLIGPFRFAVDIVRMINLRALSAGIARWLVPVALCGVFGLLFVFANPVIARWLSEIRLDIDIRRSLFWVLALSLVWPFVHVRWRRRKERAAATPAVVADPVEKRADVLGLLNDEAILRSLILFNLLFAIQTTLDLIYLWGNARLPGGISYAGYAHRGAYPLIVTALLAAGFVLAAMRPRGSAERSGVIRALVYLWVGQTCWSSPRCCAFPATWRSTCSPAGASPPWSGCCWLPPGWC